MSILNTLITHPIQHFAEGEVVLEQGDCTGLIYVLIRGTVEVVRDNVKVAKVNEPGAIFGDLSALLGVPHTAAVRAVHESSFHIVANPGEFLEQNPSASLHLCKLLARRLDAVNKYLVNVKQQFEGHDHLAMVDEMLDTLMHRQPRERLAPKASTLCEP